MQIKQHIPNLLTLVNLALGCISIVLAFNNQLAWVPYLVIAAAAADFLDGLAARVLKVSSPLGLQLDSLADMVTFGVVPGVVMYHLLLRAWGANNQWALALPAFTLTLFSALRLAKFNIDTRQTDGFIGVPTPTCTMFMMSLVLMVSHDRFGLSGFILQPWLLYLVVAVFSVLLVAELPMLGFKFKHLGWKGNESKITIMLLGFLLVALLGGAGIALAILVYIAFSGWRKIAGVSQ